MVGGMSGHASTGTGYPILSIGRAALVEFFLLQVLLYMLSDLACFAFDFFEGLRPFGQVLTQGLFVLAKQSLDEFLFGILARMGRLHGCLQSGFHEYSTPRCQTTPWSAPKLQNQNPHPAPVL